MRELLLRVTADDCVRQTFRCGGKGGQNQNKRDTGVRFIHPPSGARGESRDERKQGQNAKIAWRRMAESVAFRRWLGVQVAGDEVGPAPAGSTERIRTYHVVDRRVTDHRTGRTTAHVDRVLDGDLDLVR